MAYAVPFVNAMQWTIVSLRVMVTTPATLPLTPSREQAGSWAEMVDPPGEAQPKAQVGIAYISRYYGG